jgi:hypothetical protein
VITEEGIAKAIESYKSMHPDLRVCGACLLGTLVYQNNRGLDDRADEIVSERGYQEKMQNVKALRLATGVGLKEALDAINRATVRHLKDKMDELGRELAKLEQWEDDEAPTGLAFPRDETDLRLVTSFADVLDKPWDAP